MNYDQTTIDATYDAARGHTSAVMRQWLDLVASHVPFAPKLIVDVGCGTGRVFEPQAERFAAKVIGIDPSPRMLSTARTKYSSGRGEFRLAPAEKLPLADGCADLVFMSMVPTTSWTRKPPHASAIAYCAAVDAFACVPARVTLSIPSLLLSRYVAHAPG